MAKANPEGRGTAVDDVADDRHRIGMCRGVARAVGKENAIGLEREDVLARSLRGTTVHLGAATGELAQDVALDAVVDGHHVEAWGPPAGP